MRHWLTVLGDDIITTKPFSWSVSSICLSASYISEFYQNSADICTVASLDHLLKILSRLCRSSFRQGSIIIIIIIIILLLLLHPTRKTKQLSNTYLIILLLSEPELLWLIIYFPLVFLSRNSVPIAS